MEEIMFIFLYITVKNVMCCIVLLKTYAKYNYGKWSQFKIIDLPFIKLQLIIFSISIFILMLM